MPLKLYHCEECESEFRISPKLVGRSDDLSCPICGEEAVVEGPAPNTDDEEEEEGIDVEEQGNEEDDVGVGEEDEEDEEPPRRPGKSSRRTSREW